MNIFRRILRMNKYLKDVKTLIKDKKPVLIVIGNESVDLDSAVSSICLAFHLSNVKSKSHMIPFIEGSKEFLVVPVINSTRLDLPLKTEVTHWIRKHQIELDNLLCKDEIDLASIADSFALVDHHVSEYRDKVISVLDHRPFDKTSVLNNNCFKNIQEVGSCASLVVDAIRKDVNVDAIKNEYSDVLKLCYGAIVLDTINFSVEAEKVRPLDIATGEFVESLLGIEDVLKHRKDLFKELVTARADVSTLDSLQILSKDLKIISSNNGNVRVAIPGVDVFGYILMENAEVNVKIFSERFNIDVVVLMGMAPKGNTVERFMGIINIKNRALFDGVSQVKLIFIITYDGDFFKMIEAVETMQNPPLLLEPKPADFMGGKFYAQGNVKASRKQILPVIKQILNSY